MPRTLRSLVVACVLAFSASPPAFAELPDPVKFRLSIELGDVAQVRRWLDEGLRVDFAGDQVGTGLMLAAWEGQIALMELFVARGADVNAGNALGEQPLMHAAWRGHLEAVKWLLAHGARLEREPMRWTALHYAVFAGHEEVAQSLIERGADINARSTNGSTPLMMAAYEGHAALARRLVALGADTGIKNDRGEGALEWAMRYGHLDIARAVAERPQFAAAANQPREHWGPAVRSAPAAPAPASVARTDPRPPAALDEIERLMQVRSILAARGMEHSVSTLDRQIAALRAKRVRDSRPATVLEISAERNAPRKQQARLVTERRSAKTKSAAPARPAPHRTRATTATRRSGA